VLQLALGAIGLSLGFGLGFGLGFSLGAGLGLGFDALGAAARRFTEIAAGGSLEERPMGPQNRKTEITTKCPAVEYIKAR